MRGERVEAGLKAPIETNKIHFKNSRGREPRRPSTTIIAQASTEDCLAAIAAHWQNIRDSIAARNKAKEDNMNGSWASLVIR